MGLALDLEDYNPSLLLNCWLGHLTCKIVSEMTYNVSSGTLNPTIPNVLFFFLFFLILCTNLVLFFRHSLYREKSVFLSFACYLFVTDIVIVCILCDNHIYREQ